MSKEIERRFLVFDFDRGILDFAPSEKIVQGYFETPPSHSLRVRMYGNMRAELTRKSGKGEERNEEPCAIPVSTAEFLLKSCPYLIRKTRYTIGRWELDIFLGALSGIVLLEFEKKNRDEVVVLPPWFRDGVDVTESLTNQHLARLAQDISQSFGTVAEDILLRTRPIPMIVLTGGLCSGKSSIMEILRAEFGDMLHCVPETTTIVISQLGLRPPPESDRQALRVFERAVSQIQRQFELVSCMQAIQEGKRAVVLDRGVVDNAAYLPGRMDELLEILGSTQEYEYGRYQHALYLSMPSREVYEAKRENNPARKESYYEAAERAISTYLVWRDHPDLVIVGQGGEPWEYKVKMVRHFFSKMFRVP